jgi:hypothetical protein
VSREVTALTVDDIGHYVANGGPRKLADALIAFYANVDGSSKLEAPTRTSARGRPQHSGHEEKTFDATAGQKNDVRLFGSGTGG